MIETFSCRICRKEVTADNSHDLNVLGANICYDCMTLEGTAEVSDRHERLRLRRVAFEEECEKQENSMIEEEQNIENDLHNLQRKHFPPIRRVLGIDEILESKADRFYLGENLLSRQSMLYGTVGSIAKALSEGKLWIAK